MTAGVACPEYNNEEYGCLWHDTVEEKEARDKKLNDLLQSSTTPERARTLLDLINVVPLRDEIDTANHSKTQHYLGERNIIMSELRKLKELLNIDNCTDLIVLLTKISKEKSK
jgi:hypothetical protein